MDAARPVRTRSRALPLADAVALLAFVIVGAAKHGEGFEPAALLRTGLPVLAAWFVLSLPIGTYRRPGWWTLILTWIVAIPSALLIRSVVRGGPWGHGLVVFGGVAMGFTLLFLVVGRSTLVLAAIVRRPDRGSLGAG